MCGIVGCAGWLGTKELDIFSDMLYLDVARGKHSTGVYARYADSEKLYKTVGETVDFWREHKEDWPQQIIKGSPQLLIGHNRHATQGTIDIEHTHPFEYENLIGVHNGTVFRSSLTSLGYDDLNMDSKIIFSQLNADKDIQKLWSVADGAMALVWFDKRDMNLHMVRNLQRPLEYALSKDGKTIFWASEDWMFQVSAKRRKVELQPTEIVKSNTHYIISQNEGKITIEKEDLIPFQPPKVVYTPPAITTSGNWTGRVGFKNTKKSSSAQLTVSIDYFVPNEEAGKFKGYFMGRNLQTGQVVVINVPFYHYEETINKLSKAGKSVKYRFGYDKIKWEQGPDTKYFGVCNAIDLGDPVLEPKILSFRPKEKDKEVHENKEVAVGFRGNPLNKQEFIFSAMHGCFWCKCHLQWEDKETTVWISPSTAVCDECQKLPEVKEVIKEVEEEFRQLAI